MRFYRIDDGRMVWNFGQHQNKSIRMEPYFFNKHCRKLALEFGIAHDGEGTFSFNVALLYIFNIYLSFDLGCYGWLESICGKYKTREYGFYANRDGFKLFFHSDAMCWPSGLQFYQDWERLLKGKSTVTHNTVFKEDKTVLIPGAAGYPDKEYKLVVKRDNYITHYSRWFDKKWHRWDVGCEEGVNHPGKGTASYNCGEDATYSISFGFGQVSSEQEAVKSFIQSVTKTRETYPL